VANTAAADGGTSPNNQFWAGYAKTMYSSQTPPPDPMAANALTPAGGSQPHDNMSPYQVVNFIISMYGIYPTPT
jgi:microcystin-dependent protein